MELFRYKSGLRAESGLTVKHFLIERRKKNISISSGCSHNEINIAIHLVENEISSFLILN